MSSIGYFTTVPIGLIAISVWWVRHEDASFNDTRRTCQIQVSPKHHDYGTVPVTIEQLDPALRLDHERYGAKVDEPGGNPLGRDVVYRPLGERAGSPPDWLATKEPSPPLKRKGHAPPKIADYAPAAPPADPLETALPTEAGYNIEADEVTKIELGKQRVVFKGNVRMQSPQFLTSEQLVIFLGKDKSTMNSAEATGDVNVRLTGVPAEKACRTQSGRAIYDPHTDSLILSEWPKIKSQSQEQIAATAETKMTIITKTGKMNTEGKALTRISKAFVTETTSSPVPVAPAPTASRSATAAPPLAPLPSTTTGPGFTLRKK